MYDTTILLPHIIKNATQKSAVLTLAINTPTEYR